jgi:hypothetical protein
MKRGWLGLGILVFFLVLGLTVGSWMDRCHASTGQWLEEAAENGENHYSNYGGYSERRGQKRDSMGRYSRSDGGYSERDGENGTGNFGKNSYNYSERGYSRDGDDPHDRYMNAKHSYASTKAPEHKKEMLDALKEDMTEMQEKLREMMRNTNCREERDVIKMYMDGLTKII